MAPDIGSMSIDNQSRELADARCQLANTAAIPFPTGGYGIMPPTQAGSVEGARRNGLQRTLGKDRGGSGRGVSERPSRDANTAARASAAADVKVNLMPEEGVEPSPRCRDGVLSIGPALAVTKT